MKRLLMAAAFVSGFSLFAAEQRTEAYLKRDSYFGIQRHRTYLPVVLGSAAFLMLGSENPITNELGKAALALGFSASYSDSIMISTPENHHAEYCGKPLTETTFNDRLAFIGIAAAAVGVKYVCNKYMKKKQE